MTTKFIEGDAVVHVPTGTRGVVVRVVPGYLVVQVERNSFFRYPVSEWRKQ